MSWYDTALICKNGHVVSSILRTAPVAYSRFCKECGEETTSQCSNCGTDIRGAYHVPGVVALDQRDSQNRMGCKIVQTTNPKGSKGNMGCNEVNTDGSCR